MVSVYHAGDGDSCIGWQLYCLSRSQESGSVAACHSFDSHSDLRCERVAEYLLYLSRNGGTVDRGCLEFDRSEEVRRSVQSEVKIDPSLESMLTCPECGHQKVETM